jgi:starch-binding outer membrane protein, SusD/RagB family
MKSFNNILKISVFAASMLTATSCHDLLDEKLENNPLANEIDYTQTENMILPVLGVYGEFYDRGWEDFPLISVRGDDVNAGGLGDQQDYSETDRYNYNKDYWMYNSVWQNFYNDVLKSETAMDQVERYKEFATNKALADQYIAEIKVIRAYELLTLSRTWGAILIPETDVPADFLLRNGLDSKESVMQHISDQMDEAIANLPDLRPNERTDIPGGVTRYTALAVKAIANLELENYQAVADATSAIIASGKFQLSGDFYNLFKIPGKLNNENLLEIQYSDFGQATGDTEGYLWDFFGPENWTPAVAGATSGWGFFEPSMKYIKFMLARNETVRLETSVLFTNRGIDAIKADPNFATVPAFVTNTTRDGDRINDYGRAMFASGKHYLPTVQLTPGRTGYGTNKNFIVIRYAEILLMHAEALTRGATGTGLTADQAVNLVRQRAGLSTLTGVTADQVMDEKYAELAMEWGTRFYDMVRLEEYGELSYDGRTFSESKIFLPYPQAQVDLLPLLGSGAIN